MVAGVAFQNLPHADSIGYIIPTPVVRLFLAEVAQYGHYKGVDMVVWEAWAEPAVCMVAGSTRQR